ncbi:MAG: FAD/NAD(P)-binding oxidoreductase [Deltaproteobacteria bacterium]|nr:MAG: FAD/NAD(P)-binding oxidoreductase [Deltaproteobacteria bacterium]
MYDVVVIGAGITGSMIIRELTKYLLNVAIIDREASPGFGVTKGGLSFIHLAHFCPPNTLKARLCLNAPQKFKRLAEELDVTFKETGELLIALKDEMIPEIRMRKGWGEKNGVKGLEIIDSKKVKELEPNISDKVMAALYSWGHGLIYPPEFCFALVENAKQNGADSFFNTEVINIKKEDDGNFAIFTNKGVIKTRYIINSAGIFADEIADMVGDKGFKIVLTKATMAIFDKRVSSFVNHIVYAGLSSKHTQMIGPTAHGNLIMGLGYFVTPESKWDTKVTKDKLNEIIKLGLEMFPSLPVGDIITTFAGIRSENLMVPDGDFYIEYSNESKRVIHTIIGSPGVTASPSVASMVIDMLSDAGLNLEENKRFERYRKPFPKFSHLSLEERNNIINENRKYGHVICRCELVTEAEIKEAIARGADTIDGIKHITRAGMGRCQGGFCSPWVYKMLAEELKVSPKGITKKGKGSFEVIGYTKGEDENIEN